MAVGLLWCSACNPDGTSQQADTSATTSGGLEEVTADQKKRADAEFEKSLTEVNPRLAEAIRKGATMEEIAQLKEPIATTPEDALRQLKVGNARFFDGTARRPGLGVNQRRAQVLSQTPFAVVLGCSDSRVPIELVYDQGLGDLFVVRVAGNLADPGTLGSIEYGVQHLKSHIVVVMGHEGCGAIDAALLPAAKQQQEPVNIRHLLDRISPALAGIPEIRDPKSRKREAVVLNIMYQKEQLKKNPVVAAAIKSGKIMVVGAYYNISSGIVEFYQDQGQNVSAAF
ncbi:carbonic anhydrase [Hymenobacter lapidarius]|uniref:carbonic anhydrase n=1 Tax=Hymenobacter lapidarius TaxID=1908237 RepID=UPI00195BEBF1|nr:carbonic anhydrase [Hymenobacter lapidarius]